MLFWNSGERAGYDEGRGAIKSST